MDARATVGLDTGALTAEDQRAAEQELRETPERVTAATAELRTLIQDAGTIHVPLSDEFLIKFLRPTKFYPESALKLIKAGLDFKEAQKNLLADLMPEAEEHAFKETETVNVLAQRDGKGRRVMVLFAGTRWDPNALSTDQIFRMFYLIHQAAMVEPRTQVRGAVVIFDFEGLSMRHVRALGPAFALRLLSFCQDAMPLRLKEVHIVRQPFIFNIIWNLFKPFLKEKLKKRTFFHGSKMESLYEFIPQSDLPADFGGTQPPINYTAADWYPVLRGVEHKIQEWNQSSITKS